MMKTNKLLRPAIILLLLALNIGCDQVSKTIVRHNMTDFTVKGYLDNHILFRKVENTGAFLSLGDSLSGPLKTVLLNILPLIAILFGIWYIFTKTDLNRVTLIGIILIVGGGIGNLYDRVMHGSVTDFMHIDFVLFRTGIFNVADLSITTGAVIILIHSFVQKKELKDDKPGIAD